MAKGNVDVAAAGFKPATHVDPVTGAKTTRLRKGNSEQRSPRLKAFHSCVRERMTGKSYKSSNPKENARAIRRDFSEAAKSCRGAR